MQIIHLGGQEHTSPSPTSKQGIYKDLCNDPWDRSDHHQQVVSETLHVPGTVLCSGDKTDSLLCPPRKDRY